MRSYRSHPATSRGVFLALLLASLLLRDAGRAQQMTSPEINRGVWKHIFNVPDAKLNDPAWLLLDDDGDGISNGDEIAAGTDPYSAGSVITITRMAVEGTLVKLSFPTVKGKQYVVQQRLGLTDTAGWKSVSPAVTIMGSNAERTISTAQGANTFYRVLVQDVDSDGDGSSDWAEINLGLDPQNSRSNNQVNAYGRPLTDAEYTTKHLNQENIVTISTDAANASAEQPDAGATATDLAAFFIHRSGLPEFLKVASVQVTIGGTAVPGTDYTALAATVTLPAGIRDVKVPVTPLPNAARTAPGTVTMTLAVGAGYTVGGAKTSVVAINPKSSPSGTGLTGEYYNNSSTTYNSTSNFSGTPTTQIDPTLDVKYSTLATPTAGYTTPPGITTASAAYSIRWTGQIQPQYSEKYYFVAKVDDGVVLKLNPATVNLDTTGATGQVLISSWTTRSAAAEVTSAPVDLKAGVRYNIQYDYLGKSTNGEAHLSWYSASQVKQIIPQARLYPKLAGATAAPPVLTSPDTLYGFLGQPFAATLTASNTPTGYVVQSGTLPPGLTLSAAGIWSGTPTQAGEYPLTVRITNASGSSDAALTVVVLDTGNGLTREIWKNLSADSLISSIPVETTPTQTSVLTSVEDNDTSIGDNFGERLRGYVTVNTTGNYYFWLAGNDSAELWISNDQERVSKIKRASITGGGATARQWDQQAKQKSGWLNLVAGRKYYLEVLQKGRTGSSHNLAVGWKLDLTGYDAPIANGAGVVPGYMVWNYYETAGYASNGAVSGTLYYTKLGPQGVAVSNGSGLGTLRLSDDHLHAVLNYNYNGLSSEVVAKHLHADAYLNKPQGPIIFDIDAATPQADGSYIWDLAPVGVFSVEDLQQIVLQGKCYLNVHTVNYPAGEVRGNFSLANGAQTFVPPPAPAALPSGSPTVAQASRFLNQATFGAAPADLTAVTNSGFRSWLEGQLNVAATPINPLVIKQPNAGVPWPGTMVMNAWWQRAITAPDQVRQRMAFALSQILVVSEVGSLNNRADALSDYYDLLLNGAFGNFRDLLESVTLHPAMGIYLDMRANQKGDLPTGRHANENYAREIMQLFSIGLNRLWPDGSVVLDSNFGLVPTYDQDVINGCAQVFTGWTYGQDRQANGRLPISFSPSSAYRRPMTLVPRYHDLEDKRILNNEILPAAPSTPNNYRLETTTYVDPQTGENAYDANGIRDLDAVLDALFNHPNTGPLVCRQLIQRLVTSHPSNGYVYRVVQAFNGERNVDGVATGIRGDLKEVTRAILLDPEARTTPSASETIFGKQREPVLRVTAAARYFAPKVSSSTATYSQTGADSTLGRLTVTLPKGVTMPLTVGDVLNLQFDAPADSSTAPYSSNSSIPSYTVKTVATTGSGATAEQSFTVDAPTLTRATYTQSGTTITVNLSSHLLKVGGAVYLNFTAGTGGTATSGLYNVATVPSTSVFTVESASSLTITGTPVASLHRIANAGISVSGTVVKIYSTVPHRMVVGDKVTIYGSGGLDGSVVSTVVTVPDDYTFTVTNLTSPNALAAQSGGGLYIFPNIAPEVSRSGTLVLASSTWNMGRTDGDSSTASVTQSPLRSPTVFNFFFPDYKNPGAIAEKGLTTPEFQLTSEANTMALTNLIAQSLNSGTTSAYTDGRASFKAGGEAILMELGPLMTYSAANGYPALIDKLNNEMMGGLMSAAMRQAIIDYVIPANFTAGATLNRDMTRAVVHLILTSPEYAIQK